MAKAGGNQAPKLYLKQKEFDKINGHGFPQTLILDKVELEKYCLNVMLSTVDPLVAVLIGPEFQIGESSWAGFTSNGIFMPLTS